MDVRKSQTVSGRFLPDSWIFGVSAIENEEIIGFIFGTRRAWWNGDEFFINEMCVDTDRQNKGIGKALLHHLREVMETEAVTAISLLTDRGIPAEAFYKRNGFKEIERLVFLSRDV